MARQLQHIGKRPRFKSELPHRQALADKAHISTSKTYSQQRDYRFDTKTFTELKNAQSITLAYEGSIVATNVLLSETLLQRREQVLLSTARGRTTLMNGFELIYRSPPIQHLILDPTSANHGQWRNTFH